MCVCRIRAVVSVLHLNYYNDWTISNKYELFLIVLGLGSFRSEFLEFVLGEVLFPASQMLPSAVLSLAEQESHVPWAPVPVPGTPLA